MPRGVRTLRGVGWWGGRGPLAINPTNTSTKPVGIMLSAAIARGKTCLALGLAVRKWHWQREQRQCQRQWQREQPNHPHQHPNQHKHQHRSTSPIHNRALRSNSVCIRRRGDVRCLRWVRLWLVSRLRVRLWLVSRLRRRTARRGHVSQAAYRFSRCPKAPARNSWRYRAPARLMHRQSP